LEKLAVKNVASGAPRRGFFHVPEVAKGVASFWAETI